MNKDRLLTDIEGAVDKHRLPDGDYDITGLCQDQRDLTASIKDAERLDRPELIKRIGEILLFVNSIDLSKQLGLDNETDYILALFDAEIKSLFEEIERNFSATDYHSPEAGRGLVNSIGVRDWQALKSKFGGK